MFDFEAYERSLGVTREQREALPFYLGGLGPINDQTQLEKAIFDVNATAAGIGFAQLSQGLGTGGGVLEAQAIALAEQLAELRRQSANLGVSVDLGFDEVQLVQSLVDAGLLNQMSTVMPTGPVPGPMPLSEVLPGSMISSLSQIGLQQIAEAAQVFCGTNGTCGTLFNETVRGLNAVCAPEDESCRVGAYNFALDTFRSFKSMGVLDSILGGLATVGNTVVDAVGAIASRADQLLPLIQLGAQTGLIRGTVGELLAPQPSGTTMAQLTAPGGFVGGGPVATTLPNFTALLPQILAQAGRVAAPVMAGAAGGMIADAGTAALAALFGAGAGCGVSRGAVSAPSLFRTNACGRTSLPARTQVIGPDGAVYVVASLGRATRGSREGSVMRRLARDNGFTVGRRGSSGRRARRRPR